jgi:type IV secretion system protein VirB11
VRNGEATLAHLLAPIQDALDDPTVKEIVIQEPGQVGIERGNEWEWRKIPRYDFRCLDAVGILAGSLLSRKFDQAHPVCLTTLPGGQRFTICRPPVTLPSTITFAIRNPSVDVKSIWTDDFAALMRKTETTTDRVSEADAELARLYERKQWTEFFSLAVKTRRTIAAIGEPKNGKTTFIRKLLKEIPEEDRLVTIEDTDEFGKLLMRNRVALFFGSPGITAESLIETALRLRPDRLAMQELRGVETFAYFRALAAGFKGGLTTWHAEERDPWTPLSLMVKQHPAGRGIDKDELNAFLRRLIDIIVYCYRDSRTGQFSIPSVYYRGAVQ